MSAGATQSVRPQSNQPTRVDGSKQNEAATPFRPSRPADAARQHAVHAGNGEPQQPATADDILSVNEVGGTINGGSFVNVSPAAVSGLALAGSGGSIGVARSLAIVARDTYGNVAAWGSRYPNHDTGTVDEARATMARWNVPAETVGKYLGGNALRHFGLA